MRSLVCLVFVLLLGCGVGPQAAAEPKVVLAHYMPWYASKPVSGRWGWHWTMNHFDPERRVEGGRREVASHYYPLVGAYDSNDAHLLEYQVLLMKFAGLDGVIVDWYGVRDYFDYAELHRNTAHLIEYLQKADLRFALCYEDQSIKHMVAGGVLDADQAVGHGREVMGWLQENWFGLDAYVKVGRRPLLLVFGPQYFKGGEWPGLFEGLPQRPYFYSLNRAVPGAEGFFGWPPVHGGRTVAPAAWGQYLDQVYAQGEDEYAVVGTVFPKFHDIYQQAGLHESYGYLDDGGGTVFEQTLQRAWESGARLIQLITWNDFGEGTVIEPTEEFGYRYLEALQRRRRQEMGAAFRFAPEDLRLPVRLYRLRKAH